MHERASDPPRVTLVKWADPAEELLGIAKLVRAAVDAGAYAPSDIALCVSSVNWGEQLRRACESVGLDASFLTSHANLGPAARAAFARLAYVACPDDPQTNAALGVNSARAEELSCRCGKLKGFSLVHALELDSCAELAHALRHTQGNEDAGALYDVVSAQLAHPTLPADSKTVPIVHMRHGFDGARVSFLAACVDGLVPSHSGKEAAANANDAAYDDEREAFRSAIARTGECAIVSYFAHVDERLARAARIACARTRMLDGRRVVMTLPTPFLDEWKSLRPSTEGGQALLGRYGLK